MFGFMLLSKQLHRVCWPHCWEQWQLKVTMKKSCLAPPATRRVLQEQFSHPSLLHRPHPAGAKLPAQVVFHVQTVGPRRQVRRAQLPCSLFWNWGAILQRALAQLIACLEAIYNIHYTTYNYALMIEISTPKGEGKIFNVSFKIRPESAQNETCP